MELQSPCLWWLGDPPVPPQSHGWVCAFLPVKRAVVTGTHLKDLIVACLQWRTPNFHRVPFTGTVAKLHRSIASRGHTHSLNTIHGKTTLPFTVIVLVTVGWKTPPWEFKTEGIQWRELTTGGKKRKKVKQRTLNRPNRGKNRKALLCLPWRDKMRSSHSRGRGAVLALPEGWNRKIDHWDSSFLIPCLSPEQASSWLWSLLVTLRHQGRVRNRAEGKKTQGWLAQCTLPYN